MSFWSELAKLFGFGRKKTPVPPVVVPAPRRMNIVVSVFDGDPTHDKKIASARATITHGNGDISKHAPADEVGNILFEDVLEGQWLLSVNAEHYSTVDTHIRVATPNEWFTVSLTRNKPAARQGIVRADGHRWMDDGGVYAPLGATLFWALRGWKFERARVKQNIDYLASKGIDYIRILGEVQWTNNDISPDKWDDYDQLLAELIDYCYDDAGMRVQITMAAGGTGCDYRRLASRLVNIINARRHKIQFVEVWNEAFQNFKQGDDELKSLGQYLTSALAPLVVAVSGPAPADETGETNRAWVRARAASAVTFHFDRSHSELEWKPVRKPWEARRPGVPAAHNEPQGPRSSGAEHTEPIHLVMARAVGILCGYDAYVLHNGAGIFGQPVPQHNRPANVWEVPGIDAIHEAVRGLDEILPASLSLGESTRKGLGPHPSESDKIWPADGANYGVARDYCCVLGGNFWQTLIGIKNHVDLTFNASYHIKAYHPVTRQIVHESDVHPGQVLRLHAALAPSLNGTGALILHGARK